MSYQARRLYLHRQRFPSTHYLRRRPRPCFWDNALAATDFTRADECPLRRRLLAFVATRRLVVFLCAIIFRLAFNFASPVGVVIALTAIVLPLERLQIAQVVRAAKRDWLDVVNLPSPLLRFAVFCALHARSTLVFPEARIRGFDFSLFPDGFNGRFIERITIALCTVVSCHDFLSHNF